MIRVQRQTNDIRVLKIEKFKSMKINYKTKFSLLNIKIETNKNLEKKINYFEIKTKNLDSISSTHASGEGNLLRSSLKSKNMVKIFL